ncbi:MAG TPA: hypothetical protein VMS93_08760 [Candidatus Saccharimonadales bacterium]|nr:hypothetical protein [Candidatus Saccharimonadales bacterium]
MPLRIEPQPVDVWMVLWMLGDTTSPIRQMVAGPDYCAPYVIEPGNQGTLLTARLLGEGWATDVTAKIRLQPGAAPGTDDCLAPGQSYSPVFGEVGGAVREALGWSHLINVVEPVYPPAARAAGLEDTVIVEAIACRSGRVLDAMPARLWVDGPQGFHLLVQDSTFCQAAVVAVKQWVFPPRPLYEDPQACIWDVFIAFTRDGVHWGPWSPALASAGYRLRPSPREPRGPAILGSSSWVRAGPRPIAR